MTPLQAGFSWIWSTFGEAIAKGSLDWGWATVQWKRAADRYAERLEEDYGKLFVLGQPAPRDIDDIYTYVHLLEQVSAFKRYRPEQLQEIYIGRGLFHERQERRDGLNIVRRADSPNLFILGQPGAGKTTFLKQVTMQAVRGEMTRTIKTTWRDWFPEKVQAKIPETAVPKMVEINPIPIFISLKDHADSGRTLLESVKHELNICRFPSGEKAEIFVRYLLSSGGGIVLWDGLDEVSSDGDQRGELVLEMREFMRQYRETQFVITCRVAATEYSFDNVTYLEMADFDEDQMKKFIFHWFDDQKVAAQCWNELQKEENKGLRELARIPLLLTLLAITYEETLTFPQRRVEIYEEAIDALLKKWDSKRLIQRGEERYKSLSLGRKKQMLATIGAKTFGDGVFILPQRDLAKMIETYMQKVPKMEDDVDGEAVLRSISARHGIFVERAHQLFSFAHLSFQEYFAAKYIVDNTRQGTLELLLNHAGDPQWREVFLLTVSLLGKADADYFFEIFIKELDKIVANIELIQEKLQWVLVKQERYFQWATEKQEDTDGTKYVKRIVYKPISLRALYLLLGLEYAAVVARTHARVDSSSIDRNHARTISLALDRILDRFRPRDLVRDSEFELDRYLYSVLNFIDDLALNSTLILDRDRNRNLDLDIMIQFDQIGSLCRQLGLVDLQERLYAVPVPLSSTSKKERVRYQTEISEIINEARDLSGISYFYQSINEEVESIVNWDRENLSIYTRYLDGTSLLLDCLELAMVSDRAGIEEQLLLPA